MTCSVDARPQRWSMCRIEVEEQQRTNGEAGELAEAVQEAGRQRAVQRGLQRAEGVQDAELAQPAARHVADRGLGGCPGRPRPAQQAAGKGLQTTRAHHTLSPLG